MVKISSISPCPRHWLASVQGAVAGVPVLRLWRTTGRGADADGEQLEISCHIGMTPRNLDI